MKIQIKEEFIKLDTLLKLSGIVSTGGQAKNLIAEGQVKVDGETCLTRGKKIREQNKVEVFGETIEVEPAK
jgi:ribosome-associated protein